MLSLQKMKTILLAGLVLFMAASALGAPVQTAAQSYDAQVAATTLSLRASPSTTGHRLAILPSGTLLTLDGRNAAASWLHAKTQDGAVGWVVKAYLSIRTSLDVQSLPILGADAASSAGSGTGGSSSGGSGVAAPVVVGHTSGAFELGGQVQSLGGGTVSAMQSAGMKWVKQQVEDGDGNAPNLINAAHNAGFHILLSVVGNKDSVVDGGYQDGYASYVAGLAKAGADALEIWNEMNIDREWKTGSIDPTIYVQLLSKSFNAIKGANGNTIVISGALAPTGAEGAFGLASVWNDDHYYAGMGAAGAGKYADCIGVHYNEGIVSPNQASGDPRDNYPTRYFSTMLARALKPFPGKQACFTELGFLTPEGYGALPGSFGWAQNTTVAEQAAWLAQAAVKASGSGRVRLMIVFNVDFTYYGADPQAGYAMIRPGGGCPACQSLGKVVAH